LAVQPEIVPGDGTSGSGTAINKKFSEMMRMFDDGDITVDAQICKMAKELLLESRLRSKKWPVHLISGISPDGHAPGGKYYRAGCELVLSYAPNSDQEPSNAMYVLQTLWFFSSSHFCGLEADAKEKCSDHAKEALRLYNKIKARNTHLEDKFEMWIALVSYRQRAADRVEELNELINAPTSATTEGTTPGIVQNSNPNQSVAGPIKKKGVMSRAIGKAVAACTHEAWYNALSNPGSR
jgi:hypothetical protein